jgi:ferredoxin
MADGKVTVKNPGSCKNNCPACARICPEAAIIFPKLAESPLNGDEVKNEQEVRALIKLNTEVMLGNDIYSALAERRKKAKRMLLKKKSNASPGADSTARAYMERQKYLENEKHL